MASNVHLSEVRPVKEHQLLQDSLDCRAFSSRSNVFSRLQLKSLSPLHELSQTRRKFEVSTAL
jgi:hypothetical protein